MYQHGSLVNNIPQMGGKGLRPISLNVNTVCVDFDFFPLASVTLYSLFPCRMNECSSEDTTGMCFKSPTEIGRVQNEAIVKEYE